MATIIELRQALADAEDKRKGFAKAMTDTAEAGGENYDKAVKDFDDASTQVKELSDKLKRMEEAEAKLAATAVPRAVPEGTLSTPAQARESKAPGTDFARITRSLVAAGGNALLAAQWAEKQAWDNKAEIAKALGTSVGSAGGFLVPVEYSAEVIELLRAKAVIMRAGPRVMPMNGTLEIPRLTAGVAGSYVGESDDITKEQQTFGNIKLTSKKLAALVPVSNDLIRNPSAQADAVIREDIVAGLAVTADGKMIRGDGTAHAPTGLRHQALAANITATAGTSAANIESDLSALMGGLQDNNVAMTNPVWLMAPRSHRHLYKLRDAAGNLIYPELRITDANAPHGRLYGYPVFLTTTIPTNLGGGSNETEVYLVEMADVIIGEEQGIEIMVSDQASYVENGLLVSAFSRDQTVVRAIMKHDMALRHAASVAIKTGVTWGA